MPLVASLLLQSLHTLGFLLLPKSCLSAHSFCYLCLGFCLPASLTLSSVTVTLPLVSFTSPFPRSLGNLLHPLAFLMLRAFHIFFSELFPVLQRWGTCLTPLPAPALARPNILMQGHYSPSVQAGQASPLLICHPE